MNKMAFTFFKKKLCTKNIFIFIEILILVVKKPSASYILPSFLFICPEREKSHILRNAIIFVDFLESGMYFPILPFEHYSYYLSLIIYSLHIVTSISIFFSDFIIKKIYSFH